MGPEMVAHLYAKPKWKLKFDPLLFAHCQLKEVTEDAASQKFVIKHDGQANGKVSNNFLIPNMNWQIS